MVFMIQIYQKLSLIYVLCIIDIDKISIKNNIFWMFWMFLVQFGENEATRKHFLLVMIPMQHPKLKIGQGGIELLGQINGIE